LTTTRLEIMRAKAVFWLLELRAPFFTASVPSVLLGTVMAWSLTGQFDVGYFVLTLAGALCMHGGANVVNDYFDFKSGCDRANTEAIFPFTGGSRLLVSGILKPRLVLLYALALFALGGGIGLYLTILRGWFVMVLVLFGIISGYFYTTRLASRGIGEFFVGINFGPLLALGAYYVQTQTLMIEPFAAGLPLGLLVAGILWVNEIPDYNADRLVGKNTAVVRLGRRRAARTYLYIIMAAYLTLVAGVFLRLLPIVSLMALLTIPLATRAMRIAQKCYETTELRPANALTIQVHFATGLLLTGAYILSAFLMFA